MPNAANTDGVTAALPEAVDLGADRALIAVQGPASRERLAAVSPEAAVVGRFRVAEVPGSSPSRSWAEAAQFTRSGHSCRIRSNSGWALNQPANGLPLMPWVWVATSWSISTGVPAASASSWA